MNGDATKLNEASVRVLHVITPSRMAGAETVLARLVRRTAGGSVVHQIVSNRSPALDAMRAAGMEPQVLGIGGKANLLAVKRLKQAARDCRAMILHSHLSTASWWCGWLERLGGPPSIGHVHGFTSALWHRRQTHLVVCSAAVKRDLIEKGIPEERITVLYCPVEPDDLRPTRSAGAVRAELGATGSTPVVGTFAHLSPKKGYRELVAAAEMVLKRMPMAQFWCFGDGPLRQELETSVRRKGIADRVRFFGFRRDVADLMRAIDVMALPSHREPFGLVYVEAGICERPVVACDTGGASEIVVPGENGWLVPPRDPHALAGAILALLDNRGRAADMGRRGRELALARFQWPKFIGQLHSLYDRILQQRPGAAKRVDRQAA